MTQLVQQRFVVRAGRIKAVLFGNMNVVTNPVIEGPFATVPDVGIGCSDQFVGWSEIRSNAFTQVTLVNLELVGTFDLIGVKQLESAKKEKRVFDFLAVVIDPSLGDGLIENRRRTPITTLHVIWSALDLAAKRFPLSVGGPKFRGESKPICVHLEKWDVYSSIWFSG